MDEYLADSLKDSNAENVGQTSYFAILYLQIEIQTNGIYTITT